MGFFRDMAEMYERTRCKHGLSPLESCYDCLVEETEAKESALVERIANRVIEKIKEHTGEKS